MTWLVTGGAGYIGSHVVRAFRNEGIDCVVLDDLSSGHRGFVPEDVPLVVGSLVDRAAIDEALYGRGVSGVVHLAGFKYAGVSVSRPLHTYTQNVTGTVVLLEGMAAHGVERIVFSSSAAVYGTPDTELVTEESPTRPESPYGESKLIGEWLLRDQAKAGALAHTSLRYFNVVGSGTPELRDTSPHNLFPIIFDQLVAGKTPYINGDDYPTADGTCIRDYVHVADLASSHVAAAKVLDAGGTLEQVYNLGSGDGLSVRQIMEAAARVTGIDFTADVKPRRPGDPAIIVAEGRLAARDIDWQMRHTVDDMVRSAWEAREAAL
ncbi:MAG TPA: UDP-glucose 4-epimerase GalE [Microlunatus sp.]|nr:UDP-glucose 4-epimerase GalE [Microlunatus sp.]